jgi:nicotinate-nucleotide adenylyltransferase
MVELCISEVFPEDARVRLEPAQLEGRLPGSAAIDLVDFVKARDPGHALFFVIGVDNIEKIAQWREAERLTQSVRFLAVPRVGEAIAPQIPPYVTVIEGGEHSNAASSTVRERLRRGEAVDELVSPGVRAYIAAQGLYAAGPR